MRLLAGLGCVLLSVLLARDVRGQSDPDTLVKDGLALRRQRRDAEALAHFRRAYAIRPTARVLAQIALAEQAIGLWVDAEAHLRSSLLATDDPWIEGHREMLAAGIADIRRHLGELEIDADVAGAELWVNGTRVALLPLPSPLRAEAGSVLIEVRAEGYASARRQTFVEAGETAHETIHLVPIAPAVTTTDEHATPPNARIEPRSGALPPRPATRGSPPDRQMRAASFVFFGAAAAALGAGAYFGVRTLDVSSDRNAHRIHDARGVALDAKARTFADQSTAWFVFGTVAASAGLGMLWVSRGRTMPVNVAALHFGLDVGLCGGSAILGGDW